MDWAKTTAKREEKHLSLGFGATYIRDLTVMYFYHLQVLESLRLVEGKDLFFLSHIIKTMAADALVMQGAKSSADIVLI